MTPHLGGNRPDYDHCAFEILLDNLKRFVAGQPLRNVVEKRRGY
jgi:phosphoglycerate dehydrogenase-like enzyme